MSRIPAFLIVCCLGFPLSMAHGHTNSKVTWAKTTPLPYPVSDMSAVAVGSKIYLMGGCIADQIYDSAAGMAICPKITSKGVAFTPETKTFEVLPDAPTPRYRHAAVALGTKIYIAGGRTLEDKIIESIDVFDTVSGTWGDSIPWSGARSDNAAVADGDNIIFVGGYNADYSVAKGNKRAQVLKIKDGAPPVWLQTDCSGQDAQSDAICTSKAYGDLQVSRGDVGAVVGSDDKAYLVGGRDPNEICPGLETVEVFDPLTKKWSVHPAKKNAGRGDNAVAFNDGHIVVVGGERFCGDKLEVLGDAEVFDVTDPDPKWVVAQPRMPAPMFRMSAASFGGRVFVFGGQLAPNANKTNVVSADVFQCTFVNTEVKDKPASDGNRAGDIRNICWVAIGSVLMALL